LASLSTPTPREGRATFAGRLQQDVCVELWGLPGVSCRAAVGEDWTRSPWGCRMRPTKTLLLLVLFTGDADPALAGDKATPPPGSQLAPAARRVVRRDAGTVRWSMSLPGDVRGVRLPHLLWDAKRVYVRHRDGLTALAAETGVVVWHAEGPTERLVLSRGLLLTTGNAGGGPRGVARNVCTGAQGPQSPLPPGGH